MAVAGVKAVRAAEVVVGRAGLRADLIAPGGLQAAVPTQVELAVALGEHGAQGGLHVVQFAAGPHEAGQGADGLHVQAGDDL